MSPSAPEAVLWDALRGALVTRTLALAADLRLAHALSGGPRSVEDLARDTGADADTLERILRARERRDLRRDGAGRLREHRRVRAAAHGRLGRLRASLRGGLAADPHGPGRERRALVLASARHRVWEWLAAHPEERAAFDRAIGQGWQSRLERLESIGWRGDETVVDVGGGNGSLLLALLARQPRMRGIVFDLPETVREESTFGDRCTFVGGSFFERVPTGDAFVLSTVLHNWDDASARRILRVVRAAAPEGARLVLLESTVEPGNERDGAKWLDLLMLALFAGRERSEAQWRSLLAGAGFAPVRAGGGVIEAIAA